MKTFIRTRSLSFEAGRLSFSRGTAWH